MINNVVLVGRMTRDAELVTLQSNRKQLLLSLAVNHLQRVRMESEADFINCVIYSVSKQKT